MEMAREFPDAEVLGLDIVPNKLDNVPPNCSFATWNLNDGLSQYYGQFNIVHARFVQHGVSSSILILFIANVYPVDRSSLIPTRF